ncbi:hypothetical protein [Brevundimonas variabilis]|uniref:Uncharacterized protein n=1 Tax=Brevundimonas variabilis TaxID=74312 RepID=A0A7W9CKH2_9CAUL|nr:hypothetical protein [Brevundimonas variabilis]MBB5747096.1 hypothetical protein [Brevundimonas variabilis]
MAVSKNDFLKLIESFRSGRDAGVDAGLRIDTLSPEQVAQVSGGSGGPNFPDRSGSCPYPDGYTFYECIHPFSDAPQQPEV